MNKDRYSNFPPNDRIFDTLETGISKAISLIEALPAIDDPEIRQIFLKTLGYLCSAEEELLSSKPTDKRLM